MIDIKPKNKPKWYQIRSHVSGLLFKMAKAIDPKGPYTNAHLLDTMVKAEMDAMLYGMGAIKIEHVPRDEMLKEYGAKDD